jgi:hypothetical protein
MLVPQSYRYQTMSSNSIHGNTQKSLKKMKKKAEKSDGKPKMLSSISAPTPSKPVIIPTKTATPKRRSRIDGGIPKVDLSPPHDPQAIPPSMAALLAVASVHSHQTLAVRRKASGQFLQKENLSPDDFRYAFSSSSPKSWNILQSPPDDLDDEPKEYDGDTLSITSGSTVAPFSSYRSISSDSMPSLDMDLDLESPSSPGPLTPAFRMKQLRRGKVASPRSSLGSTGHPLSPPVIEPDLSEEVIQGLPLPPSTPATPRTPKSQFKSNLTASIRLLKSAARSLSAMAPTHYSPDPIARKVPIISRGKENTDVPAKPIPSALANIDGLPFHLHLASPVPTLPPANASIQLMPYVPSTVPASALATAPPIFLPAASPSLTDALDKKNVSPRPREPRENSDFLRVVVLEMNMRRVGKLSGEGRARIWLGPRSDGHLTSTGGSEPSESESTDENKQLDKIFRTADQVDSDIEVDDENICNSSSKPLSILLKDRERKQVPSRWIAMSA